VKIEANVFRTHYVACTRSSIPDFLLKNELQYNRNGVAVVERSSTMELLATAVFSVSLYDEI
jgi:hypothetical protein